MGMGERRVEPEVASHTTRGSYRTKTYHCKWSSCSKQDLEFTSEELSRHVDSCHVLASEEDLYWCQWEGCKMYNQPCCSYGWLERHVRTHTKERPNRCFMNGCNRTFNSTEALQKHLNRHFRETSPTGKKKPSKESSIKAQLGAASSAMKPHQSSLIMRTLNPSSAVRSAGSRDDGQDVAEEMGDEGASGRVLQAGLSRVSDGPTPAYQSQRPESLKVRILRKNLFPFSPYSKPSPVPLNGVHMHSDVMDRPTMSGIRATVNCLARQQVYQTLTSAPALMFTPQVMGERVCLEENEKELLVRWHPRLLPDEWVAISKLPEAKSVRVSDLPVGQQSLVYSKCFSFNKIQSRRSKRKP